MNNTDPKFESSKKNQQTVSSQKTVGGLLLLVLFLASYQLLFRQGSSNSGRTVASAQTQKIIKELLAQPASTLEVEQSGHQPSEEDQLFLGDLRGLPYRVEQKNNIIFFLEYDQASLNRRNLDSASTSDQGPVKIVNVKEFIKKNLTLFVSEGDSVSKASIEKMPSGLLHKFQVFSGKEVAGEVHILLNQNNQLLSLSRL